MAGENVMASEKPPKDQVIRPPLFRNDRTPRRARTIDLTKHSPTAATSQSSARQRAHTRPETLSINLDQPEPNIATYRTETLKQLRLLQTNPISLELLTPEFYYGDTKEEGLSLSQSFSRDANWYETEPALQVDRDIVLSALARALPMLRLTLFDTNGRRTSDVRELEKQIATMLLDLKLPNLEHVHDRHWPVLEGAEPSSVGKFPRSIKIGNKAETIRYIHILLAAIDEAINHDPLRHHNNPPPALRLENSQYLDELRELVTELRRLNDLLEAKIPKKAATGKATINLYKHFDTFIGNFASSAGTSLGKSIGVGVGIGLGIGATGLLVGTAAALFHHAGLAPDMISRLFTSAGQVR